MQTHFPVQFSAGAAGGTPTWPGPTRPRAPSAPGSDARHVSFEGLCWPAPEQRQLLRALFAPLDLALPSFHAWRSTLDLDRLDSGSLSLMPLLYRRLAALGAGEDPIQPRLRGARHYHWCRNEVRLRRCFRGIDALQASGCPVVALKGLASLELYGDIGLRPMSDVDLLVPRDRAATALDALLADGWSLKHGVTRSQLPQMMQQLHGVGLSKGDAEIDIHWASLIEDLTETGDDGLWQRARPRKLWQRELLVPSPVDLLLHTCVHGARFSRAMSVTWVPDSVRLIETHGENLDWSLLLAEARRRVFELPLRETLRFLKEELACPVPAHVLDELRPRQPAWVFWLDHYRYAVDPLHVTSWHRAVARVVDRLRRGLPMPADLTAPGA